jgi:hypothetical protein
VTVVAWVGEGVQASKAHSEVAAVAVLNSAGDREVEVGSIPAAVVSLHPYDLVSETGTTISDHDQ